MQKQSTPTAARTAGFTLIELLIAMVIVGIISAVAFSSYQKSILKTGRAQAKGALTRMAAEEEQYRFSANAYTSQMTKLNPAYTSDTSQPALPAPSYFNLSVTATASTYTITATATGRQTKDTDCQTFTLTNTGVQAAKNSGGTVNTTTCWGS
jgi:type IV pilus assembly protein PilE